MRCEREKKEDTILIVVVLAMDVHSAQLTEALRAPVKEGECNAVGDADY